MVELRDYLDATLKYRLDNPDDRISNYFPEFNDWTKRTDAEISAGVTPVNYAYPPGDVRRKGAVLDGVSIDTAALQDSITAEGYALASQGGEVSVPNGAMLLDSSVNLSNRVVISGRNKRGSIFRAQAGFSQSQMFTAVNGTSSMFDNRIQDCTIDCNNVTTLSGVIADAWQEGGGLRDVLVQNFTDYGVLLQNAYGGAAICAFKDCEFFGSSSGCLAGLYANDTLSAVAGFLLRVENSTFAGGGATTASMPIGIHADGASLTAINVHFEVCQSGIYLDGPGHHTIIGCTGASGSSAIDTLVELASTFTGTLTMIGCFRNGATNFLKDNRTGGFGTITGYDIPHLHINASESFPIVAIGQNYSGGYFDGTAGSPTLTAGFNVASITKNGTGDYTITENRVRPTADCAPWCITNSANASHRADIVGTSTYRLRVYVGGVLADANEVKFGNVRLV